MFYIMIAMGGALGALSRYGMTRWINTYWHHHFPFATMLINILGCFLMGVAFVIIGEKMQSLEPYRPLVMVGFLGAFTTFSTFSLEIIALINMEAWLSAVSYLLLSCLLGIAAVAGGIFLARYF
ncbi:Putative fluoride ion transporter CrcB [Marinomonas spartinae]|uniref:Fluoride-specific ion channel FluC n=1 Tax=Marinomonas spartinae TaxID=1792290 RepID=A0A1A8TB69_9GAMM|nr:fluoride efflux transporter CrcB [Marinomonas spartinae]SBS27413.1 Putative fluoride ion transporter CrcB [Marinomonas spartinae]SBS28818.1 Putative fluoride ion transporter CrcB [Marinomonas spartinae]